MPRHGLGRPLVPMAQDRAPLQSGLGPLPLGLALPGTLAQTQRRGRGVEGAPLTLTPANERDGAAPPPHGPRGERGRSQAADHEHPPRSSLWRLHHWWAKSHLQPRQQGCLLPPPVQGGPCPSLPRAPREHGDRGDGQAHACSLRFLPERAVWAWSRLGPSAQTGALAPTGQGLQPSATDAPTSLGPSSPWLCMLGVGCRCGWPRTITRRHCAWSECARLLNPQD